MGLEEVKWGDEFVTTDDLEGGKGKIGTSKRVIKTKQSKSF